MKKLQALDKGLGLVACSALQPLRWIRPFRQRPARIDRVLLIKFWGLGSLQLLTPAARCLRLKHPGARLTLLTLNQNRAFAEGLGVFDEVMTLDVAAGLPTVFGRILGLARRLRSASFHAVYDFEFFTRFSAVMALLTGARETHGFAAARVWRGNFHTHTAPFNRYWHVARNFRCLAGGENAQAIAPDDLVAFVPTTEHRAEVERVLAQSGLSPGGPLVVLNPNAGSLSLERRWPQAYFASLGQRLIEDDGARVVLIGAPSEVEWTGAVAARMGALPKERFADLSGRLSIGGMCALFEHAEVFVTNDSGPMHLAAARGTPTVGLFGPETPVMYAPIGLRARALYAPPPCSPCINVHDNKVANCVRGLPECLLNLSVADVLAEARAQRKRSELRPFELPRAPRPSHVAESVPHLRRAADETKQRELGT